MLASKNGYCVKTMHKSTNQSLSIQVTGSTNDGNDDAPVNVCNAVNMDGQCYKSSLSSHDECRKVLGPCYDQANQCRP